MKDRNPLFPILGSAVLSIAASSSVSAQQLLPIPLPPQTATPASVSETTSSAPAASAPGGVSPSNSGENPGDTKVAPTAQAPAAPATTSVPAPLPPHTTTYVVEKGDSLTRIAEKFNTTRKKLQTLNNLKVSKVTPGQILLVPSYKKKTSATASTGKTMHPLYPMAQPVQPCDVAAATATTNRTVDMEKAPIAKLVSPAELQAEIAKQQAANRALAAQKPVPVAMPGPQLRPGYITSTSTPKPSTVTQRATTAAPPQTAHSNNGPSLSLRLPNQNQNHGIFGNLFNSTPAADWGSRFLQQARYLGGQGIEYDEDWRPPGESHAWTMDCSNTARYLYKVTTGINLPRTASDQYYYLHLQGKAWDVPCNSQGWADGTFLREHLKPGDLLFWENTYRPERNPPITHVMIYLGVNAQGQWLMAGSQSSSGGEHNRRNGGPDIYVFRPSQPCGGYTTWLGMVHHRGRFCAFGRPLEADPSKLAMATN